MAAHAVTENRAAGGALYAQVAIEQVPGQLFTYAAPEALGVRVGQCVTVPWRRVYRRGYVVALSADCPYAPRPAEAEQGDLFGGAPAGGLKAIEAVEDPLPYFSEKTIALLRWMAAYYDVGFTLALRSALPAPVREGRSQARERFVVAPILPPPPHLPPLSKRQKALYEDIVRVDGGLLARLCEEFKTTAATIRRLAAMGYVSCERKEAPRSPLAGRRILPSRPLPLTPSQARALEAILGADRPTLLFGVTGSGKTEVYMQAIARTLEEGRGAIVLVPEISLTPQTVSRFAARFGGQVAVLHSALSDGERHDEWHRIRRGQARVVVGPRSAVFAPLPALGLIIVDEEHDTGYKQDESPRYSARDVAVMRAHLEGARCVLGSATPSLESWRNAVELGKYALARLPERVGGAALPAVSRIDLRQAAEPGRPLPLFSPPLIDALRLRLERGEQAILFLNRRGYAPTYQCAACGEPLRCPRCAPARLTYHAKDDTLRCHLCGHWERPPTRCPACGAPLFKPLGAGTQRVEQALAKILPQARVIRMDADSTGRRHSHDELLSAFRAKEADILLGTQMIAKGLDFPNVTLVGILSADRSLNIAYDFRAAERTFQLIAQVSGRAGRGVLPGEVVVQTLQPDHPAVVAACACDYERFAADELALRRAQGLPPYVRLATLTFTGEDPAAVERAAQGAARALARFPGLDVAPPLPAPLERKEDRWRWQILLKAASAQRIARACRAAIPRERRMGPGLRVLLDVDAVFLA